MEELRPWDVFSKTISFVCAKRNGLQGFALRRPTFRSCEK